MNWQEDPCSSLLSSELWGPYNNNWNIARRHGDCDDITSSLGHAHVNCHETETISSVLIFLVNSILKRVLSF
ncbi:hypothetical protein ACSQ67_008833 [Phaseolus vulgaris]